MSAIQIPSMRVRPSAWWYLLIPLVLLAGAAAAITAGIDEAREIRDSFHTLGNDGRGTIELEAGDEPTVWAVWNDGRSTDSMTRPPANVQITGPGGQAVPFRARGSTGTTTWSFGSDAGVDLGTFSAPETGSYEVHVMYDIATPDGSIGAVGVPAAAVGQLDLSASAWRVARPVLLATAAAVGILVLLLVLRGRSKRRVRQLQAGSALDVPSQQAPPAPPTPSSSSGPISFE